MPSSSPSRSFSGLDAATRTSIFDAMRVARATPDGDGVVFTHPEQQLHATIAAAGTTIAGRDGAEVRFTRARLARRSARADLSGVTSAAPVPLAAAAVDGAGATRVTLARAAGEIPVTEWWNNTTAGIEQGFTIAARPAGEGLLALEQTIDTALTAEVSGDGATAILRAGDTERLRFAHLRAWDREGRDLRARLDLRGDTLAMVVDDTDAAYPVTIDPTWTQQAYLKASNTGAGDNFGFSVAVSGDTLVVGAPYEGSDNTGVNSNQADNNSASQAGAAYVFVRTGTSWTQQAYLKASNTGSFDTFGFTVAVSGDTVVVGAPFEASNATGVNGNQADNSASGAGAAYVFVRTGTTWTQQAYLKASNTTNSDLFGFTVAVSGDTLVVGALSEDSNATGVNGNQADESLDQAGAAYVFARTGTTWTQQAYLKASNTGYRDHFGSAVSVSGDTLVVAADSEDSNATGVNGDQTNNSAEFSGAAYVFVRTGTTWTQQAYLKASNTAYLDRFGQAVALSGDTLVVATPVEASNATGVNGNQADNSAANSGAAYVFVRTGTTWAQQAYLKASNTGAGDNFGASVVVSGDTVVVGARSEASNATGVNGNQADNSAGGAGSAYVFVRTGTTWTQQAYLKASNTVSIDGFGTAVTVSGNVVVVGAAGEDSNSTGVNGDQANNSALSAGAAYVFELVDPAAGPGAFSKTAPANGDTGQSTSPTLSWTASVGATGYEYCRATSALACTTWTTTGTNTSVGLNGLTSNTTYYWQVRATNAGGTTYANGSATAHWSFTTQAALPPGVATLPATGVISTGATLNGTVNPNGSSTTAVFDFGLTVSYGSQVAATPTPGSGSSPVSVSATTGSLSCATTYHFRLVATNASAASGGDLTFTTAPCPAPGLVGPVQALAVDPTNGNTVYAGTTDGVFKSVNGGVGWSRVYGGPAVQFRNVIALAIDPHAPCSVYAGLYNLLSNLSSTTLVSTDCGSSWGVDNRVAVSRETRSLSFTLSSPATLYRSFAKNIAGGLSQHQIARSVLAVTEESTPFGDGNLVVAADPANACTAYAGGFLGGVYQNTSCGVMSWTTVGTTLSGSVLTLAVHPTNQATLLAGTADGKIFRKVNAASAWVQVLAAPGAIQAMAYHPGNPLVAYAASDDGHLYKTVDGGAAWGVASTIGSSLTALAIGAAAPNSVYAGGNSFVIHDGVAAAPPGAFNKTAPANNAPGQSTSPTLIWTQSTGATSYDYCYDIFNDSACSVWTPVGTSTSVGLTGLSTGTTYYWQVRASNAAGTTYAQGSATSHWAFTTQQLVTPLPEPDLNSDGNADLLFENTSGALYGWFMDGQTRLGGGFLSQSPVNANLLVVGVRDFTGDGKVDLLLQHQQNGTAVLHIMDGLVKVGEQAIPVAANTPWQIVSTGDINNDGYADIVWQHFGLGRFYVWFMKPAGGIAGYAGPGGAFYGDYLREPNQAILTLGATTLGGVGTGDVNGDGRTDLLLQDDVTGALRVWYLDGQTVATQASLTPASVNPLWKIRAVADYNGDGRPDLVWQHITNGGLYLWFLNGASLGSSGYLSSQSVNPIWRMVGAR